MYELVAKAGSKKEVDMMLHGTIADWDKVNSIDFNRAANAAIEMGATQINLKVHSPGGNPFEGIAIGTKINEMRGRGVRVHAEIQGLCASMMSAVVCFCDKVIIAKHGRMMVHQSKGIAVGSAAQIIGYGKMMTTMNETLAEILAQKTGKEKQWILENWMADGKDKWFKDSEAVDAKLADEISGEETKVTAMATEGGTYFQMAAHYDQFFNKDTNENLMKREELIALFGLKADATDAEIKVAVEAAAKKPEAAKPSPEQPAPVAAADKTQLVASFMEIVAARGITDEKQIANFKKLAEQDMSIAIAMLPAATAKASDEKTPSIAEIIAQLKGQGGDSKAIVGDKKTWKLSEWQKKDPEGLMALTQADPKEYCKLFKAEYGTEISVEEVEKLLTYK